MTQTEALKQLREVHAIQGRDGCWDIDDYMLGLYNGLELALSIVENRECRCKQRPKSQLEQEHVAIRYDFDGYGYQYIDSGTGSDWQTRVQGELLYTAPQIKVGCAECGVNGNHALYCVKCAEKYLKEKNT